MSAADLSSKDHRHLLDIIDQLRSQGVSRYVDLPEIIVCGDQSAGKSSVLEAISGMSFPTKDNLCTRFATELIMRRDSTDRVKVSITPGYDRLPEEKNGLSRWQPEVDIQKHGLREVVEEAKGQMGLSATKMFCNDTLRVELSGPTQPHLTMVDLPGLFRAPNKEQSEDNVELVKGMVTRYMKRPRSIILAVVSAKNESVLQDVTVLAKKADREGLRTIGLITKPDTLDSGSESEQLWIRLAKNDDVELRLGWHVLKNRSYEERHYTSAQRDAAEEKFFHQGVWATIGSTHCGVASLRSRLSKVLKDQILNQLPSLVQDIEYEIKHCKAELDRMGDNRQTPEQQLRYLSRISQEFSSLMKDAIQGIYNSPFFGNAQKFEGFQKRLRAFVQNRLTDFAREMHEEGQSQRIVDLEDEDGILGPGSISRTAYVDDARELMRLSRGCELPGLFNPLIVGDLFALQCQPWQSIVNSLTEEVLVAVYETTSMIAKHTVAEEAVDGILQLISGGIEQLKSGMEENIQTLLQPHYYLHAITYNDQLAINVQDAQRTRNQRAIEEKIKDTFGTTRFDDPNARISVNPAKIVGIFLNEVERDMTRFGGSLAVDYMEAYYKLALERFIDDVSVIAIEGCLISKLPDLFTPSKVLELEAADISRLVGETDEAVHKRQILSEKLKVLERGLRDIRRQQRQRDITVAAVQKPPQMSNGRPIANGGTEESHPPATALKVASSPSEVGFLDGHVEEEALQEELPAAAEVQPFEEASPVAALEEFDENLPVEPTEEEPVYPFGSRVPRKKSRNLSNDYDWIRKK